MRNHGEANQIPFQRPPSVPHFYHSIVTLADRLERYAGIRIPDGNVPLLLWRLTKEIGGTRKFASRIQCDCSG